MRTGACIVVHVSNDGLVPLALGTGGAGTVSAMQIQAALTHEPDAPFIVESVELDDPRPDEILVRIAAAGVCHTDLSVKASWPAASGPLVLGHEGLAWSSGSARPSRR